MRKIAVAAIAVLSGLALGGLALAQVQDGPASRPKAYGRAGHMAKALDLTDQQKQQIRDIMTKARADAANASDPQAKHEIFKAARQQIRTTVLTDQQRMKLVQMHRHHHGMKVLKKLDLTADQKTQVKAIFKQAKVEAGAATDPQARKQIRKDAWQKVRTQVLTDAQRQQLDQMKANRKARHSAASHPA